jgi:small GTP-binding protein
MELRRFYTAGEVDDGKSTLIGRLFLDAGFIQQDQLSAMNGNLAHFTDGLRAERSQGITLDVAYRYFETATHKFIVADAPGHLKYIRHMVTAASLADAAVILVDATRGVSTQTKRHAWIARWLGIQSVLFVVNKMDRSHYSQERFDEIRSQLSDFPTAAFIPASALLGDNILDGSAKMPWYQGPSLMSWLQNLPAKETSPAIRFSVQYVLSDGSLAGQLISGEMTAKTKLLSDRGSITLEEIHLHPIQKSTARAGESLRLTTAGPALQRGDLIFDQPPIKSCEWKADWLFFEETSSPLVARTHSWEGPVDQLQVETVWDWEKQSWGTGSQKMELPWLQQGKISFAHALTGDPFLGGTKMGQMILIDSVTGKTVAAVLLRQGG